MSHETTRDFLQRREREIFASLEDAWAIYAGHLSEWVELQKLWSALDEPTFGMLAIPAAPHYGSTPSALERSPDNPLTSVSDDDELRAHVSPESTVTPTTLSALFVTPPIQQNAGTSNVPVSPGKKVDWLELIGDALSMFAKPPPNASLKDVVLLALRTYPKFKFHGAENYELREFIQTNYKREVAKSSLSPTLSRLRNEGTLDLLPDGRWKIADGTK